MKCLIAEFEKQSFTQIIFPHAKTDWAEYLDEARENFANVINAIVKYQKCLVICADVDEVSAYLTPHENLYFAEYETDDTWARDCSALSIRDGNDIKLLNFTFTGWGGKFDSLRDDAMTGYMAEYYPKDVMDIDFVLEGGGVESNGKEIIMTTSKCMLNKNRNRLSQDEITAKLKGYFGASKILYLNHGYLAGDDTDSHIDTLARFTGERTVMYVKCEDKYDEHYAELKLMEDELKEHAKKFKLTLIPLPLPGAKYHESQRLPATYANFLFVNGAVLVPTYGVDEDEKALDIFKKTFQDRDIVAINCSTLIKQHGSLHCITMNFA